MRFSRLIFCLVVGSAQITAQAFVLISEAERLQYSSETEDWLSPLSVSATRTPAIEVVNPNLLAGPVPSPVTIEVTFRADDATIDLNSFQIFYGGLRLNITSRVLEHVTLTDQGLTIQNAQIPSGRHRLFLEVSDSKGRKAQRELRLQVH
jgi:hypothetical protein